MRVPVAIAEQVDRYAKTHEITRTDAIDLFLRYGLELEGENERKRVYTGRLRVFEDERLPHEESVRANLSVEEAIIRSLEGLDAYAGEFEEEKALTARLPPDLVNEIEAWAESQGVPVSVGAARLLERGMRWDPLPESYDCDLEGEAYTLALEPEQVDLFRRYRLTHMVKPGEAASNLLRARHNPIDWGSPSESDA
jgi:hypothetical protein